MRSTSSTEALRIPWSRWLIAFGVSMIPAVLAFGCGHRGVHAARSFLVPGAGMLETQPVLAVTFMVCAATATAAWLAWGTDWLVAVIVIASMVASAGWGSAAHEATAAAPAVVTYTQSHEFPLVLLFVAMAGWTRATLAGVPGFRWLAGRRSRSEPWTLTDLSVPERCRAIAILSMAHAVDDAALGVLGSPAIRRRARWVGAVARWRFTGDPLRADHAYARAAMLMCGLLEAPEVARLKAEAGRSRVGAPCSEPTWVRPLDATLVAVALEGTHDSAAPERWRSALAGPFAMRRGHRAAWWWSPLGLSAGRCPDWEHALVAAIAYSRGWTEQQDWAALRQRVLGAAARGVERSDDERLVAAGRLWLNFVDDPAATEVLDRPSITHDPLAVAIDRLAEHVRTSDAAHIIEEPGSV